MRFYEITSFEQLAPGCKGIMEPAGGVCADGVQKALMIMPGVAFDEGRNRVGYGGGYYDRYLEAHPDFITVAVAFDFQVLPEVPADPHDRKPMFLVTESRTFPQPCLRSC